MSRADMTVACRELCPHSEDWHAAVLYKQIAQVVSQREKKERAAKKALQPSST